MKHLLPFFPPQQPGLPVVLVVVAMFESEAIFPATDYTVSHGAANVCEPSPGIWRTTFP
jgi:hypothetical protein